MSNIVHSLMRYYCRNANKNFKDHGEMYEWFMVITVYIVIDNSRR